MPGTDPRYRELPAKTEDTATEALQAAFQVHSRLGSGLLENVYQAAMQIELEARGLQADSEVPVNVSYREQGLPVGLRLDVLVEDCLVLELKCVDGLVPAHTAQVLTYLKATGCRLGLILNFREPHLRDGIKRAIR